MRKADIEDGIVAGTTDAEASEIRALKKRMRLLEQENEVLRRAAAYSSQANPPKIDVPRKREVPPPLVRELAATDALIRVPVAVTRRILGFSKQAFYAWEKDPVSDRVWDEAHLINAAVDAHRDDPTCGYRFIADELTEQGFTASDRRIWRLCSQ